MTELVPVLVIVALSIVLFFVVARVLARRRDPQQGGVDRRGLGALLARVSRQRRLLVAVLYREHQQNIKLVACQVDREFSKSDDFVYLDAPTPEAHGEEVCWWCARLGISIERLPVIVIFDPAAYAYAREDRDGDGPKFPARVYRLPTSEADALDVLTGLRGLQKRYPDRERNTVVRFRWLRVRFWRLRAFWMARRWVKRLTLDLVTTISGSVAQSIRRRVLPP